MKDCFEIKHLLRSSDPSMTKYNFPNDSTSHLLLFDLICCKLLENRRLRGTNDLQRMEEAAYTLSERSSCRLVVEQ